MLSYRVLYELFILVASTTLSCTNALVYSSGASGWLVDVVLLGGGWYVVEGDDADDDDVDEVDDDDLFLGAGEVDIMIRVEITPANITIANEIEDIYGPKDLIVSIIDGPAGFSNFFPLASELSVLGGSGLDVLGTIAVEVLYAGGLCVISIKLSNISL